MLKRTIPSSGEEIAAIGVGTWRGFDIGSGAAERDSRRAVLETLLDADASVIDSSPMYGRAEGVAGDLLADLGRRDDAFVATKVWTHGRREGMAEMENSFRVFRTDVIDLMQIHNLVDWQTQLDTMRGWKADGRFHYLGYTHYRPHAFDDLMDCLRSEPVDFVQFCYSIDELEAEDDILPFCEANGIATLINLPFGGGEFAVPFVPGTAAGPCHRAGLYDVGAVLPEIRDLASGGHLRDPRHVESYAYGRPPGRRPGYSAGRDNAARNGRGVLARSPLRAPRNRRISDRQTTIPDKKRAYARGDRM